MNENEQIITEGLIKDLESIHCNFDNIEKSVEEILKEHNINLEGYRKPSRYEGELVIDINDNLCFRIIDKGNGKYRQIRRLLDLYFDYDDNWYIVKVLRFNNKNYTVDKEVNGNLNLICDKELYTELRNKLIGLTLHQNVREDLEKVFDHRSFNIYLMRKDEYVEDTLNYVLEFISEETYLCYNYIGICLEKDVIYNLICYEFCDRQGFVFRC